MPRTVQALVAADTSGIVRNATIERRQNRPHDVDIEIKFCGICHSDLHQLRAEWAIDNYFPMVAGHEIVGIVNSVGEAVTRYAVGDRVGVGCFVDSCRSCSSCKRGMEQYCGGCPEKKDGIHLTYNCKLKDYGGELTFGGYSTAITVDENYVVRVPDGMELSSAAPLLCAGVTLFSPLSHFGCNTLNGKEMKVGIQGFGGLGQMGVKLAVAMGVKSVTVLSRSAAKRKEAEALGAQFLLTSDAAALRREASSFDLIISTAAATYDVNRFFDLLVVDGHYCLVGLPPNGLHVNAFKIVTNRRSLVGSLIGSMKDLQDTLNFCSAHNVECDVVVLEASKVNVALADLAEGKNGTKRFVIDLKSLLPETKVEEDDRIDPNDWEVHKDGKVIPASADISSRGLKRKAA